MGDRPGQRSRDRVAILFDTSVLRGIRVSKPSPEFRLLKRLADRGRVELFIPEMVLREWEHQLSAPSDKALQNFEAALATLSETPTLRNDRRVARLRAIDALSAESLKSVRDAARQSVSKTLGNLGFKQIDLGIDCLHDVLDRYFGGQPPFEKQKARADLPDALVLASVRRANARSGDVIFVCADDRLRAAGESEGVLSVASISDALRLDRIAALHEDAEFAIWWEKNVVAQVDGIRVNDARIVAEVTTALDHALLDEQIAHPDIPDDNHTAVITGVSGGDLVEIRWDQAESLGEGLLSVPVVYELDVDLHFYVYRGDLVEVPEWVFVARGNYEDDHYFSAEAMKRARFSARLVMGYTREVMATSITSVLPDLSLEDLEFDGFVE